MGIRFILHILLSLGHFETEVDLVLHTTLRESLRYSKLIGPLDDAVLLKKYSVALLKLYFTTQVVTFPNSSRIISIWINAAGELFDSIIIRNEISIYDLPPVLQLSLNTNEDATVNEKLKHMKMNLITAAFKELHGVIDLFGIVNKE